MRLLLRRTAAAIAEADGEAQRVREQRLEHLERRLGGRATTTTTNAFNDYFFFEGTGGGGYCRRCRPTTRTPARTPPSPRFLQQQHQQQTRATPPPNMTTPIAPSPLANLNPGGEWWTPGTAAINASLPSRHLSRWLTNMANDESSLSEEDISARRMAHAAAAAVAAAAQQAQMAFMSVAPLGLLPPGSNINGGSSYFPASDRFTTPTTTNAAHAGAIREGVQPSSSANGEKRSKRERENLRVGTKSERVDAKTRRPAAAAAAAAPEQTFTSFGSEIRPNR